MLPNSHNEYGHNFGLFIPLILTGIGLLGTLLENTKNRKIEKYKEYIYENLQQSVIKIYILAGYILGIFLVFAYTLSIFKSPLENLEWYNYGFFNKKYVFFTYLSCMVGFLFGPYFYRGLVEWKNIKPLKEEKIFFKPAYSVVLSFTIVFLVATYFWGPIWNIHLSNAPVDTHEIVHLAPLLGIDQGRLPFTEAQIQYGPGSQLFQYIYLKNFGFDLLHLRESFLIFHYIFVILFFGFICLYLPLTQALTVTLFALCIPSSLSFFGFSESGELIFMYGWGNGFRYLGPPFLALATSHIFAKGHYIRLHSFIVGVFYGLFLYMAQENFSCGIMTIILCFGIAYVSKIVRPKDLLASLVFLLLGVMCVVGPILFFYGYHHQLGDFIRQYFGVSSLVVQGYSNTPWSSGWLDPYFFGYIFTPILLFGIGFTLLYTPVKNKFEKHEWLRLVFLTISAIALHQISLFRADSSHFFATCLTLPILFGLIFFHILKNKAFSLAEKIGYASSFLLILLSIYPWQMTFERVVSSFHRYFEKPTPTPSHYIFFKPNGFWQDPNSKAASYNDHETAKSLMEEMQTIQKIINDRPTIVAPLIHNLTSSVYYFANLNIGTNMIDNLHSMINSEFRAKLVEQIKTNPIKCLVSSEVSQKEFSAFRERFPNAKTQTRTFNRQNYRISCIN